MHSNYRSALTRTLTLSLFAFLAFPASFDALAQPWTSHRPDGHAPISVMNEHTHGAGEFMLSYRFMPMFMSGNLDGTTSLTAEDIVDATGEYGYLVTPTEMQMTMHMLGGMWAPTDDLTLVAMAMFHSTEMDHVTRMSVMDDPDETAFTTSSSGLGDVSLTGLYTLARPEQVRIHAGLGVSLPTGSIEETGVTPMSDPDEAQLPYPMQLGSGTVDLLPSVTYLGQTDEWSWGAQAGGKLRFGENDRGYRLGDVFNATAWGAYRVSDLVSASLRGGFARWGNVSGSDEDLNPMMVPTADPSLRAGTRVEAGAGLNVAIYSGVLDGARLAGEFTMPVYQDLAGPQLETDWTATFGVQYTIE